MYRQYEWLCKDCDKFTLVERHMKDYLVPPDDGCEHCGSKNIIKCVARNVKVTYAQGQQKGNP